MIMKSDEEKGEAAAFSIKDKVLPVALGIIYLLCTVRYYPGRPVDTLIATAEHLLASIPFSLGFTLLVVSILAKVSGQRPPWIFVVRLFLTFGIIAEFFFGLYHYLASGVVS